MLRVALSVVRQSVLKTDWSMASGASGEEAKPPTLARPRPGACLFTRQAPVVTIAAGASGEEAEPPILARPRPSRASLFTVLGLCWERVAVRVHVWHVCGGAAEWRGCTRRRAGRAFSHMASSATSDGDC